MTTVTVSSKGQIALPKAIRMHYKVEEGTKLAIQETPHGIMLIPIPKNPLLALKGIAKHLNVSSKDIIAARKEDEKHDREKYKTIV